MARPSKPYTVIKSEKKSHRTKAELEQRKRGEESLLTGLWQATVIPLLLRSKRIRK